MNAGRHVLVSRRREKLKRRHAVLGVLVGLLTAVVTVTYLIGQPDEYRAAAAPQMPARSWCPVTSPAACARYLDPAAVHGITIAALENYILFTRQVRQQIQATGPAECHRHRQPGAGWNGNLVRFQIVQDKLVGAGGRLFSPGYMAVIGRMVSYALHHCEYVVLNAQTEPSMGFALNESVPTVATWVFWRHMAQVYGHNPRVIFDLFNEPRYCSWPQWYAAFQPLVTRLRAEGSLNELWVEGRWWGSTLAGVPLLHGRGIVYSVHHPGAPWPWESYVPGYPKGITGPPLWNQAFGNLAAERVPVVDSEFVNYLGGYYWPRSTQMVSEYLRYLAAHHIGVVAWSLQAGIMTANGSLTTPVREPQGAGQLIWRYFHGQPLPAARPFTEVVHYRFGRG